MKGKQDYLEEAQQRKWQQLEDKYEEEYGVKSIRKHEGRGRGSIGRKKYIY